MELTRVFLCWICCGMELRVDMRVDSEEDLVGEGGEGSFKLLSRKLILTGIFILLYFCSFFLTYCSTFALVTFGSSMTM